MSCKEFVTAREKRENNEKFNTLIYEFSVQSFRFNVLVMPFFHVCFMKRYVILKPFASHSINLSTRTAMSKSKTSSDARYAHFFLLIFVIFLTTVSLKDN